MPVKLIVDDPARRASYTFHQVHESLVKLEDKMHRNLGITTQQFGVLAAIKSIPPPATPTAIAEWLDRNTNSVTLILDRMEKDDLISRVRDLDDRRSLRLEIREKGSKAFTEGVKCHRELYKELMSCLRPDELPELIRLMDKVLDKTFEMRQLKEEVRVAKIS